MDLLKSFTRASALVLLCALACPGFGANSAPQGNISISPSGDTSGVTDAARLQAAFQAITNSKRLPPSASAYYATARITLQPGTFYYTTGLNNILGSTNTSKIEGVWIFCSGRNVTDLDYNPSVTGTPFLINNRAINVKFTDCSFVGHDATADFLWSQEQAGLSNVQDYTWVDNAWQGNWNNIFRLTGGNNNSEWKFDRDTIAGSINSWIYTPPSIATTITASSSSVAATNNAEQIEAGDTGSFTQAVSVSGCGSSTSLAAGTQLYVVAATTTTFQVSQSFGGSACTFTATPGTQPNFTTASDQFLNFWFSKAKFDTGSSNGQWFVMNYGGSIKIYESDISGHSPSNTGYYVFNLYNNGPNSTSAGVNNFEADGLRVEHANANSALMNSQWGSGSISWNNLDESSQYGSSYAASLQTAYYNISNARGPIIEYRNSQLMGKHAYANNTSNYQYQNYVLYEDTTLLNNPSFYNFITITNTGNSGGEPRIRCSRCRNLLNSTTVGIGYHEVVDTDLNWNKSTAGQTTHKITSCVSANSDWPFNGGNFQIRLPLNAEIISITWWLPVASGGSGAYNYSIQTTEATPTVLGTVSGSNSATPVPASSAYVVYPNFVMTSDAARTIEIVDTITRTTPFTNFYCLIDYIG